MKESEDQISREEFLSIYNSMMDNFTRAESLSDAGDDAMTTSEIKSILIELNPFISTQMLIEELKKDFSYQFDFREKKLKWLLKYRT